MPHKFNASRRHRIPKAKYKVLNWNEYGRGLVQRGDIRFWIAEDVLDAWTAPIRNTPGPLRDIAAQCPTGQWDRGVILN